MSELNATELDAVAGADLAGIFIIRDWRDLFPPCFPTGDDYPTY